MRSCRFCSFCVKEYLRTKKLEFDFLPHRRHAAHLCLVGSKAVADQITDYSGLDDSNSVCVEVTVAIISSSDQKSWTEDECFFLCELKLKPLSSHLSLEKQCLESTLFLSQGLSPYLHIPGECCADT